MPPGDKPLVEVKSLFQIGIVVRDLQKSMKLYQELFGIDEWADMEVTGDIFDSLTYKGRAVKNACFLTGMADVGALQLELIQPVEGDLPYFDFLKEHGEGLHHVGHIYVPDMDVAVRQLETLGFPCVFAGSTQTTKFAYIDMTQSLGLTVELIEVTRANA